MYICYAYTNCKLQKYYTSERLIFTN